MVGPEIDMENPSRDADNVLLCASTLTRYRDDGLRSALARYGEDATVMVVTFHQLTADELASLWPAASQPASVDIVRVRSNEPTTATIEEFAELPFDVTTETVEPSESFTELGTTIKDRLSTVDESEDVIFCLDSITTLLLYGGETQTEKFVRTLRETITDIGGCGYYYLDQAAHDDELVNRLSREFDAVLESDEAGRKAVCR